MVSLTLDRKSFGKLPAGKRLDRIRQSPNYHGKAFRNLSPTRMLSEDSSYLGMVRDSLRKAPERTPSSALPVLKADFSRAAGPAPAITWFGHSSYLVQAGGKNILVDPVFSERVSFVSYLGPRAYPGTMQYSVNDLPPIDVVIISHDHYDHLDYLTMRWFAGKDAVFVAPLGVGAHLTSWGIPEKRITELDWGDGTALPGEMRLTAAPARHFSGRGFLRNRTLWASFVLETGTYRLYLGGDSGYGGHFREIGKAFGPFDIVILENGQYNARWPFIHMMPEETVQACIDLGGKVLLPVHWGKYTLSLHAWNEPAKRITKKAKEMNVTLTTPRIGETVVLGSVYPADRWWDL